MVWKVFVYVHVSLVSDHLNDLLFLKDIVFLEFPYDEQELDISKLPPLDEIAAVFIETYQGWGACMYPKNYLDKLTHRQTQFQHKGQNSFVSPQPLFEFEVDLIDLTKGTFFAKPSLEYLAVSVFSLLTFTTTSFNSVAVNFSIASN